MNTPCQVQSIYPHLSIKTKRNFQSLMQFRKLVVTLERSNIFKDFCENLTSLLSILHPYYLSPFSDPHLATNVDKIIEYSILSDQKVSSICILFLTWFGPQHFRLNTFSNSSLLNYSYNFNKSLHRMKRWHYLVAAGRGYCDVVASYCLEIYEYRRPA